MCYSSTPQPIGGGRGGWSSLTAMDDWKRIGTIWSKFWGFLAPARLGLDRRDNSSMGQMLTILFVVEATERADNTRQAATSAAEKIGPFFNSRHWTSPPHFFIEITYVFIEALAQQACIESAIQLRSNRMPLKSRRPDTTARLPHHAVHPHQRAARYEPSLVILSPSGCAVHHQGCGRRAGFDGCDASEGFSVDDLAIDHHVAVSLSWPASGASNNGMSGFFYAADVDC